MTLCPTCKLSMESHSTSELMECCMKQVNDDLIDNQKGICPLSNVKMTNKAGVGGLPTN